MIAILLLITWAELWQKLTQATNSHAATSRGVAQFAHGKYRESAKSFAAADSARHSPLTSYNLGTAQVASGNREEGSKTLGNAMRDPKLRADALYNRGSSALAANSFDAAIRDLSDALRVRPNDPRAKRNLEIALRRKAQAQQQAGAGQRSPKGNQPNEQQPNRAPAPGEKQSNEKGQTDADALLRAVQQQEREELSRMRQTRAGHEGVGW